MTPVAPRIGNEVSYVTRIKHRSHFRGRRSNCEVQVSHFVAGAVLGEVLVLLFVAGAVLGEVQVLLFVAGAALGECLNVRLGAKRCIFQ